MTAWYIVVCDTLQSYEPEQRFKTLAEARPEAMRIMRMGHKAVICLVQEIESYAIEKN